jgi:proton-dependent oligopeptide transporter, POT family
MCINLGSLSPIITTNLEKYVGFWAAYLIPMCMFIIGFITLILGKKKYVVRPPKGSVVVNCFSALWIGIKNGGKISAAKPSYQAAHGHRYSTPWDDHFIDELSRALVACKVFLFFPIYW